jgi:hypothetical protein
MAKSPRSPLIAFPASNAATKVEADIPWLFGEAVSQSDGAPLAVALTTAEGMVFTTVVDARAPVICRRISSGLYVAFAGT